ncbi:MAG TPA: ferritin family protein [Geobacterales bacterium]|nr:ferritin family protein [Geobacterales bacterium]
MMKEGNICYTFEGAIEMAITMEQESFRHYLEALRKVESKGAREILREAAADELEHKLKLEKALLEGHMAGDGSLAKPVPTMNLDYVLAKQELRPDSDVREALAFAIHLENGAIDFYKRMSSGCAGAPMGVLFDQILANETHHLQQLEDLYDRHCMPEN